MDEVIRQLPRVYRALAPELELTTWPSEEKATCSSCAMAPKPGANPDKPWSFTSPERCCTYIPDLTNHAVGRVLRRGGVGAERMMARIESLDAGIRKTGVGPTPEQIARYDEKKRGEFGRMTDHRCPFWVGGEHACSIWHDRNGVCRTWFCKFNRGVPGQKPWNDLQTLLTFTEEALRGLCIERGQPPGEGATAADWREWYIWCSQFIERLTPADFDALRATIGLPALSQLVVDSVKRRDVPMSDVLVPSLRSFVFEEDRVILHAVTIYDPIEAPPWVFDLFAHLDGVRTWKEAVALTEEKLGVVVPEDLIPRLFTAGLVESVGNQVWKPGMSVNYEDDGQMRTETNGQFREWRNPPEAP